MAAFPYCYLSHPRAISLLHAHLLSCSAIKHPPAAGGFRSRDIALSSEEGMAIVLGLSAALGCDVQAGASARRWRDWQLTVHI